MEIKGTAVKTVPKLVKSKFPDLYDKWFNLLPEKSKKIFQSPIMSTSWYDLYDSVIAPTNIVGDHFYDSRKKASWELGRFSSEDALTGVYKIFIRVSSPLFVLSRITNVFSTYYKPAKAMVLNKTKNKAVMQFIFYDLKYELVAYRIAGWIERTIEITKKKDIKVDIKIVSEKKEYSAIIVASWV